MLYMIRHGKTDWNAQRKLQGRTDIPLNEEGREMARNARNQLEGIQIDLCFSSPLVRAMETAQILFEGTDVPIVTDERLSEMSFGVFEGIQNSFDIPDCPVNVLFHNPGAYDKVEGGESIEELTERTGSFLREVVEPELAKGKNILIVGHGAMNCSIYNQIHHVEKKDFWQGMTGNCELVKLSHERRKRYSGTHPKKFEEKYKELNPEKYADTVAKVIAKGSTPAGMHISIMVNEVLECLKIQPGEVGLDATLGYGGHSRKMLEQLSHTGHLYSLDVDPIEIVKTEERLRNAGYGEEDFTPIRENFANIDVVAEKYGPFQFLMADLGVSSMQIDDPKRGFSYKLDGPLDLRLNPEKGIPASERLLTMTREEIEGMLVENSDEPYADKIASKIVTLRKKGKPVKTTTDLYQAIVDALWFLPDSDEKRETVKKTCQRVFQAIRIDINSEFEVLEAFLNKLPQVMAPGGRVAILTFHSGEDRLVKKAFQEGYRQGIFCEIARDVIRPSAEECRANGRAKSTKLRWAIKKQC